MKKRKSFVINYIIKTLNVQKIPDDSRVPHGILEDEAPENRMKHQPKVKTSKILIPKHTLKT